MYEYPVYPGVANLCRDYWGPLFDEHSTISTGLVIGFSPIFVIALPFEIALDSLLIHVDFFKWLLKPEMVIDSLEEEQGSEIESES